MRICCLYENMHLESGTVNCKTQDVITNKDVCPNLDVPIKLSFEQCPTITNGNN